MKTKKYLYLCVLYFFVLVPVISLSQQVKTFKYSVKFICGQAQGKILAPGLYLTAINVHNPNDTVCYFQKKISIALQNQKAGPTTIFYKGKLGPHEAMEIDCQEIREKCSKIPFKAKFLKGFVCIESKVKLNVVAVYSAAKSMGQIETLHLEQISPLCLSTHLNGSSEPTKCKPISEFGEQCFWRFSKNSKISFINISRSFSNQYLCEMDSTAKYKTSAIFKILSNPKCDQTRKFIPDFCLIKADGYEIIRSDSAGIFTGIFKFVLPTGKEIASGDIYIITKVGTHRRPLPTKPECEPCDPKMHSEGYLCGELTYRDQIYQLYCQIAIMNWYPASSKSVATFEGVLTYKTN